MSLIVFEIGLSCHEAPCGPGNGSKEVLVQNSTRKRLDTDERRQHHIAAPAKQRYQYTLPARENLDQFAIYQDLS